MPLAFKSFELVEPLPLEEVAAKLKGYGVLELEEVEGKEVEVGFRVADLQMVDGELQGLFEESFIISVKYREELFKVPITVATEFRFTPVGSKVFLTVAAKKARANRVAARISAAVAAGRKRGVLLEARIPEPVFRRLYEGQPHAVKVVVFTDVKLPDVGKLTLYGEQLANSSLYNEYLKLGSVWYAVFEAGEGVVVGVTRNCIVTFFSKIDPEEAFKFIKENILPLALEEEAA
ncbi:MAG: hypothetical protein NZ954_07675 [Thermofilaceae archaeon]|nr:hypothetical protein [Thermofilaceae archaeon]MCX8179976.1 hypothetical protein [Thermofilaceae archaeon]MDW8004719.1 hypothetical protein [Thermofilaceae archaeon]